MKIHIPAFQAAARCNEHMNHGPIDIDLGEDVVKVTRCRECKYMNTCDCPCSMLEGENVQTFGEVSFCSYGEPREKDSEH